MFDRLTETPILVAIIGVLSAALVVPAFKKWYFDIEHKLVVKARYWKYETSKLVKNVLKEESQRAYRDKRDASPYYFMPDVASYLEFEIQNPSRKLIENVSLRYNDILPIWYQLEESENLKECKKDEKILIGDIQPGHTYRLHIWSRGIQTEASPEIGETFHVSANKIDKVAYVFPIPKYIKWYVANKFVPPFFWGGLGIGMAMMIIAMLLKK